MDVPFLGMIAVFAFSFAPNGWAFCDGQIMSIAQNSALFALVGTTYGGNGQTSFALPDLRGRVAIHPGSGPGLPNYAWGESSGFPQVTLLQSNMPAHVHTYSLPATTAAGTTNVPTGAFLANTGATDKEYGGSSNTNLGVATTNSTGNNVPISIMQPYLAVYHCIALQGIFPSRN